MKTKHLLMTLLLAFALPWAANAQRDDSCEISYALVDSFGDGWNGGQMVVTDVTTSTPLATLTISDGSSANGSIEVINGHDIKFSYTTGSYAYENSWTIYDVTGAVIWEGSGSDGDQTHTYTAVCPSCLPPADLTATLTEGNGTIATLSWTQAGDATNWVLEYGTSANLVGATSVNVSGTPSKDLTGLTPETKYYARVKADCGGGDESDWTEAINFKPTNKVAEDYTVYENASATNEYVPFYGYYADATQQNQMIFPASDLADLDGGEITQMVFYIASVSGSQNIGNWIVSLGETTATTLNGLDETTPLTQVYSGPMNFNSGETLMTVTFTEAFEYNGGNLLVEFNHPVAAGYKHYYFTGVTAEGASYCYDSQQNFLPKVTFTYYPNPIQKPKNLTFSNLTAQGVTASWTAPNSNVQSYEYQYGAGEDWTSWTATTATSVVLSGLTPDHTYTFRVKAIYAEGTSNYIEGSFTTLATCPVPTALNVPETTITAHEATLLWTADNDSYNIRYQVATSITEGFEGGTLPEGWIVNKTSSSTGVNSQAAHEGSYGFQFYYSEQNASLISPLLSGTENGVNVSFYYKEYSSQYGDEQFQVGYTTDASVTDAAAFTYGNVITASLSWQLYENSFPAGTKRVAIKYIYNDALYLFIDDITFAIANENWFTATSNTTSYNFRSLAPETTYTAQVQGVCDGVTTDWSEAISFTTTIACPAPTNLVYDNVTKNSVELSWTETGGATEWEICINGDEENLVGVMENPYTLDRLDPQTDYTVKVRAVCGGEDGESAWSNTISFTTVVACPAPTNLVYDNVTINSVELSWTESGEATEWELCVNGDTENLIGVTEKPYTLNRLDPDTEYTVKVRAVCGGDDGESQWSNTITFTTAEACAKPTNLAETNITTNSATLSWNGTSEHYVLQYRPWTQVGEDQLATGGFVTYTYDLSEFRGQGSIAIRHYDVTDMFYLNVDNVELKDAGGTTIFLEDFESGSIPSTWTNYDVDGDGYVWDMASSDAGMNVIGNYAVYSASYDNNMGALTPDNWLIIPNVELGGTFSFAARGQDASYFAENFAVYVSMESDIVEVPVNGTSYNARDLRPATPYAWQVKSDCGEYQSNWVTSMFNTKDDVLIFATDGNWNNLNNWTDVDGEPITALPTVERKVRVDADAIVPAGVVATAGKTTINGGSITVKDGGELKHNTATLWVTMEKDITAWTIGETIDENNKSNGWYFISTPFSGTTEIEASGAWSHVNNLAADGYDLYGFDPTEDQEWINYRENPTHAVFTAGNNHGLVFKRGYLYASDTIRTVTFTGTISKSVNNSMTEAFDYDGTSTDRFNGWALVGNPFSCSAYITYGGEEANFYVMNAEGNGYELSQSSVALAPLTGAFINYSSADTVQFSTEVPVDKGSGMLSMTINQGRANVDMARVRFGRGYNLKHMSFRNNSSKLYIPQDNDYAVVYTEDNVGEMPVSFKAERNGTYTLGFNTENVEFSYLHLIDNLTGNDVNLLATPSYSFEAQTTDYASRFKLVFATGSNDDNFAFFNNGNIIVNNEGEATLQVMDVNGRIIRSESINGTASIKMNAAAGVYMLRLINGNDVKVQKMIVK